MKKTFMILIGCLQCSLIFSQSSILEKDTLRNIELPATIIRQAQYNLISEKIKNNISASTIKKQNTGQDLPYLLNNLSSVVVTSDAGTGTGYTGIRIRGADLTRINVTLNGVPVNDAESQTTYFVNMPDLLGSTKEIEVSKGVGSSKSGVGSFGASIGINTIDVDQLKPTFSLQSDYGSFNTFKRSIKASTGLIHNKFVSTIRLSAINSNGYVDRSASALKGMQITSKYLIDKNTQLVFNYMQGNEKTEQAWNGVFQDSLMTNRTHNSLGVKSNGTFYNNQTDNYGQQYYQLFFDKKVNSNFSLGSTFFYTKGKGYYEEYKMGEFYSDYNLSDITIGNDTIQSTDLIRQLWLDNDFYGLRIYGNYLSKKLDAGVYLNLQAYEGRHFGDVIWAQQGISNNYRWYDMNATKNENNIYGMMDYRFTKNLSFFADIQVRNVNYTINGFRKNPSITHQLNYTFLNPKVKLSYVKDKQAASLLVGIAQKEPNRDDFEAATTQIPKPEKMWNTELNISSFVSKTIALHATAYSMLYKDQLVLAGKINDVGAYTRSNVDNSYRVGIELEAFWKPSNKWIEMRGNVAWSANKIVKFVEYIDDADNGGQIQNTFAQSDISFSPSLIASSQFTFHPFYTFNKSFFQYLSIDVLNKYVGRQFLDNTSNKTRSIKSYHVSDMILNCPLNVNQHTQLNLRIACYNVFNKMYEANGYTFSYIYNNNLTTENYFYPQAGRRFMVGVGINL